MRNPDEQERFLTAGRFERWSAKDRRLSMGTVAIVALIYWVFAALAFLLNFWIAFLATLPWSYFIVSFTMHLSPANPIIEFINSKEGGLFVYPFLCGGLNVVILIAVMKLVVGKKPITP